MEFGEILRDLRTRAGLGIRRLGPELGVSYTYLSKLENLEVRPSEDLVRRVARYFAYDEDQLLMSAGRIPQEILDILRDHPEDAIDFLRRRFSRSEPRKVEKRRRN
jgi:transcriptional regulator with XRE-family HTH domain